MITDPVAGTYGGLDDSPVAGPPNRLSAFERLQKAAEREKAGVDPTSDVPAARGVAVQHFPQLVRSEN
jgi:hypothetical protein